MSAWELLPVDKCAVSNNELVHVIKFCLDIETPQRYVDLESINHDRM